MAAGEGGAMTVENPGLLGQIALNEGMIRREQLDEAVALRSSEEGPLGEILVREGHLTREQLERALEIQASRFRRVTADPNQGGLFGQMAVRLGYISPQRLRECVEEQAEEHGRGSHHGLGQFMLRKGYVTAEQFMDLLARQNQVIVKCPGCDLYYDLSKIPEGKTFQCSECRAELRSPGLSS